MARDTTKTSKKSTSGNGSPALAGAQGGMPAKAMGAGLNGRDWRSIVANNRKIGVLGEQLTALRDANNALFAKAGLDTGAGASAA